MPKFSTLRDGRWRADGNCTWEAPTSCETDIAEQSRDGRRRKKEKKKKNNKKKEKNKKVFTCAYALINTDGFVTGFFGSQITCWAEAKIITVFTCV